ncbi:MAG TPA: GntR family transcriptional regulator [Nocardioidaceae bacterium]|nr:GntR family transcriptional regulator [Nocardioidaceae bacterium]
MRSSARPPRPNAAQRAYDFAKWAILNAVYPAGSVVTVSSLAGELGLSRNPVREALLRLEAEGLVRVVPRRGAVVATFSPQEVEDVLEARILVENYTAARSFQNRKKFLPDLLQAHDEMKQRRREQDTAGFTRADRLFHEIIVDGAENAVLSEMYRSLRERQTLFTSTMVRGRTDRMDAAIAEHEGIIEKLEGDDEDAFIDVLNSHLQWSIALARSSTT